jgi:hypothetical protein
MPRRTTRRRKATRRRTSRLSRFSRGKAKSGALGLGRSASNIVAGAALYEAANRVMPNRFGSYQLPANMIAAGFAGQVLFKGGQKDLITAGSKILTRRIAVNMILPRLSGLSAGNGGRTQTARAQGGY